MDRGQAVEGPPPGPQGDLDFVDGGGEPGIGDREPSDWQDFVRTEITGFRAPYLSTGPALIEAEEARDTAGRVLNLIGLERFERAVEEESAVQRRLGRGDAAA